MMKSPPQDFCEDERRQGVRKWLAHLAGVLRPPSGSVWGGGSQCEEEDQVQRQEVGFPARSDLASSSCPFIWEEAEEQKDWEE